MKHFYEESTFFDQGTVPDSLASEEDLDFESDSNDEDWEDSDWGEDAEEDEPDLAPEPDEFDDQESFVAAYRDWLAQQPTGQDNLELNLAKDNILDRMGLKATSRPEVRQVTEQADEHFQKSFKAELEGKPGEAKIQRQRAAYHGRDVKKALSEKTGIEQRAEKEIMDSTERAIKAARHMDSDEYAARYPQGRGFKEDLTQLVDSWNENSQGSYLYVLEGQSSFDERLGQIKSDRPVSGSDLRKVKLPEWTNAQEVVQAARDSNSTLLDYVTRTGIMELKQAKKKREEPSGDEELREVMNNAEYRESRGFTKGAQIPYRNRLYGKPPKGE